jgi:hypothetical protein
MNNDGSSQMVGIKAPLALDSFLSGLPDIDSNKGNRFGFDIKFHM